MDDRPQSPNLAAIRKRLNTAFDDVGLEAFIFDQYPDLYEKFSRGLRKDEKITLLLDHCRRIETLGALPAQIDAYQPLKPTTGSIRFRRNDAFVDREEDLARLHQALTDASDVQSEIASVARIVAIRPAGLTGLGGIGKTQLAVEYAYLHQDAYPGGIFWIDATRPLAQGFASIASYILRKRCICLLARYRKRR